ncbi:MAG: 4-phosphopantetheinyl transferase [Gemmatimonadetes bacterium]|nr:4-phosphopantetheinyl transferase [Gemmatimonadota bacterium]
MTIAPLDVCCEVWPQVAIMERLAQYDVAVYTASLRADSDTFDRALATLDTAERTRYERHLNGEVARRFAVGRLRLREMLGAVLGTAPAAVPIRIGLHGKPTFDHAAQSVGVRFSVAHCEDLLVVALSRAGEVGVDVERVRPIERWTRVAERVFSASDRKELGQQVAEGTEPAAAFFRYWCRTEAELKAIGSGITGLTAHREGWRPPGLRLAELPDLPLPDELRDGDFRYQSAVAICAPRDASTFQTAMDPIQARMPSITPTSPSTA